MGYLCPLHSPIQSCWSVHTSIEDQGSSSDEWRNHTSTLIILEHPGDDIQCAQMVVFNLEKIVAPEDLRVIGVTIEAIGTTEK